MYKEEFNDNKVLSLGFNFKVKTLGSPPGGARVKHYSGRSLPYEGEGWGGVLRLNQKVKVF
ncbi:hypothetical protein D5396_13985 [Rahnella inusitata]|uniref:Uncharacterized protein n=1 Tax=Rahnella inusitata TaxID=58169 RepID=A0ABX9NZL6_9GAMM|nr:hypothetical protein D5396_13985 [Rahnella inusitata]